MKTTEPAQRARQPGRGRGRGQPWRQTPNAEPNQTDHLERARHAHTHNGKAFMGVNGGAFRLERLCHRGLMHQADPAGNPPCDQLLCSSLHGKTPVNLNSGECSNLANPAYNWTCTGGCNKFHVMPELLAVGRRSFHKFANVLKGFESGKGMGGSKSTSGRPMGTVYKWQG